MRFISYAPLIAAALVVAGCARTNAAPTPGATSAAITPNDLRVRLFAFAADSMMGREAGTIWNVKATDYVASEFAKFGLRPAGDSGTFFQIVPNVRGNTAVPRGPARNVIAIFPGSDPALRGEYVAITAHNDHIGFTRNSVDHDSLHIFNSVVRPMGADSRMRAPTPEEWTRIRRMIDSVRALRPPRRDSIRNGADDDGSGTIALIEIAEALARGNVKPRRSILLVSHTAEEAGLIGSEWFTDHPTVPIHSIVAEFDVDMIGRGAAADIAGGGPRTSRSSVCDVCRRNSAIGSRR